MSIRGLKRIVISVLAVCMIFSLCGCASKATVESLQDEISDLEEKNSDLKDENKELRNEMKDLEEYVGTLEELVEELKKSSEIVTDGHSGKVGISLPTKDLQRWNRDGAELKEAFEAAGYAVDLQYANNMVDTQLAQIEAMINSGCELLIISAVDGTSLGYALDKAKQQGIPVIAYDRLIYNTDAVDYYVTFDNYSVGTLQAQYVIDMLDLDNAAGPFNIEFTAGESRDENARLFFDGAYDTLKPYIDSGKLVVVSGQTDFEQVATESYSTDKAQGRAESIMGNYYSGKKIDAWLCSNDSTALGVEKALENFQLDYWPVITGQDCDLANMKNMLQGKQSMSVFKETRVLVSQTVKMAIQIMRRETVDVNDDSRYFNGEKYINSYLCTPVFVDINNYRDILINSGYYTEADLT